LAWQGDRHHISFSISNEFAGVVVRFVATRNGGFLEVRDVRHGLDVRLDALELEALTRLTADDRAVLVDPSRPGLAKPSASSLRYDEEEEADSFDSGFDLF
jgi:hypothetical protein